MKKQNLIENFDHRVSVYIQSYINNEKLSWWLSRINRGEVFLLVLVVLLSYFFSFQISKIILCMLFTGVFAFITDRLVLLIKKIISRKRPLLSVSGKEDKNPDMKHSFPSAHAANSMVVVVILVLGFHLPGYFFLFPLFAGIGRLLSLHHYVSDVAGGWIIGGGIGILAFQIIQLEMFTSFLF
ncbi:MAG: phosphatase PAP2 family protein [Leptospiraceae bacterium]|nr:phosphatase PAP2 family protein [Leptospiraceae bacterium]MCK6382379.1 phosphatase PAP2 family protein [Leptospiraceae bacterium]NUM41176.1 phosphatase PAP2 family protein [Leptospiraceae bacterium]